MGKIDFYVYAYYEPGDAQPIYIGKGFGDRALDHLEVRHGTQLAKTYFHKKLKSLLDAGYEPEIQIMEDGLSEEAALAYEQELIHFFGRRDLGTGCLYNSTDGGDGVSGHIHSEESRKKIREARAKQAPWDLKYRQQLSERMKGNQYALGHVMPTRKPVIGRMAGIIVERFASTEHAKRAGYKNVIPCLKGRRNECGGLMWEYE